MTHSRVENWLDGRGVTKVHSAWMAEESLKYDVYTRCCVVRFVCIMCGVCAKCVVCVQNVCGVCKMCGVCA